MPARIEQFQAPGWTFDFHETHVKARVHGPIPPDWASLGLMRSACETVWYGQPASRGVLVCTPPGEAIDGSIVPGFECCAINVPRAVWERCRMAAGIDPAGRSAVVSHHLPPALYAQFERALRALRHLLRSATTAPEAMLAAHRAGELAAQIFTAVWELSATAPPPRDSLRNRARLARRAEAWMHDHLAESVSMSEFCLALGVSRRELEYAFRSTFGESPRHFLQALRLNAVRRTLLRRGEDRSVTDIAIAHGLFHLGRFAGRYRALFGEPPSATRLAHRTA
jgi:AraC-like DNA-binding protein